MPIFDQCNTVVKGIFVNIKFIQALGPPVGTGY